MIRGNWKRKLRYVDEQKLIMIGAIKQIVGLKEKNENEKCIDTNREKDANI